MALPVGSRFYQSVPLAAPPVTEGALPLGQSTPPAQTDEADATVFAPGGSNGQSTLLDAGGRRVLTYVPTADGRTLPGQVGPYAVLVPQPGGQPVVNVALPPDIARFLAANSPLEGAMNLLAALLLRVDLWSKAGCQVCGDICRAVTFLLGGFQRVLNATTTQTVDLHLFLTQLKGQFAAAARLFKARANEATGTAAPLVQAAAQNAVTTILAENGNATVAAPTQAQLNPLLATIAQGVLLS
jgi:hypothetical protein